MPKDQAASGPTSKSSKKLKGTKPIVVEKTGLLWAIDSDGGLQILNGEESEATMVDYYGLYWNAKAGPKKMNGKAAPVFTSRTQPVICMRAICVCFMRVHTLVSPITCLFWVVWFVSRLPTHVFLPNFVSTRKGRSGPCMYLDFFLQRKVATNLLRLFLLKKRSRNNIVAPPTPVIQLFGL
jgi:hypothetical protein